MAENMNNILLTNILTIINAKGITEKECLEKAGLSTSYLSDWKSGKSKNPTFDRIYRIAKVLDEPIDKLISFGNSVTEHPSYDNLSPDEYNLLNTYREMDETGKKLLQDQMRYLWADHRQPSGKLSLSQENNCG